MVKRFLSFRGSLLLLLAACGGGSGSAALDADASPDTGPSAEAGSDASAHDASAPNDGSIGVACTGASPSFANDVSPILQRSCGGGEFCHSGLARPWTYTQLVNAPATRDCATAGVIVSPGDLEKSYLVHKVTGVGMCAGSERMPRGGPPLPAAEIQTLVDWICKGAAND